MSIMSQMFASHPTAPAADESLTALIESLAECGDVCAACADACLASDLVTNMRACIRLNFDCAEVCRATESVLARRTAGEPELIRALVEACQVATTLCATECERHADVHEHCRICAEACRATAEACATYLGE